MLGQGIIKIEVRSWQHFDFRDQAQQFVHNNILILGNEDIHAYINQDMPACVGSYGVEIVV